MYTCYVILMNTRYSMLWRIVTAYLLIKNTYLLAVEICSESGSDQLGSVLESEAVRGQHRRRSAADDRSHRRLRHQFMGGIHCRATPTQGNVSRKSGAVSLSV